MIFESPRWGTIEVDDARILHFATGLAGFSECRQFIVMDHDRETPLKWLQCVDRPELAFLVIAPEYILSSYDLEVPPAALRALGWEADGRDVNPQDIGLFVILNANGGQLTANLRAPVVVHIPRRQGLQIILESGTLPLRHPVVPQQRPAPEAALRAQIARAQSLTPGR
jgi:flagellar assembly factor FliW